MDKTSEAAGVRVVDGRRVVPVDDVTEAEAETETATTTTTETGGDAVASAKEEDGAEAGGPIVYSHNAYSRST